MPDRDVVHEDGAGERAAERELVLDRRCGEAFRALFEEEAADFVVPFAARPDNKEVTVQKSQYHDTKRAMP